MYTVDFENFGEPVDPAETEGMSANAGQPLPAGTTPATRDEVIEKLRECYDPEIPVNIYDLGLVYDIDVKDNGDVAVEMTLTAPACPVAGEMPGMVAGALADLENIGQATVTLTWDPPWTMDQMSEDARLALGFG